MLVNHFDQILEVGRKIDSRTNQWWCLSAVQVEFLDVMYDAFREPSRIYKYEDYGAFHYTFIRPSNYDEITLYDFLLVCFPNDPDFTHMIGTWTGPPGATYELAYDEQYFHPRDMRSFKSGDKVIYRNDGTMVVPKMATTRTMSEPRGMSIDGHFYLDDVAFNEPRGIPFAGIYRDDLQDF